MATTLQFRRGSTANLASETGAVGELFVDTDKDTLVVMDGSTAGGFPLSRETTTQAAFDQANTATNNAASASAYANTGINNAASASEYANTGITLAQAAFNQANTGSDLSQVSEDILPLVSGVYDIGSTDNRWYDGYFSNKTDIGGAEILGSADGIVIPEAAMLGDLLFSNNMITPDSSTALQYLGDSGVVVVNGNIDGQGEWIKVPVVETANVYLGLGTGVASSGGNLNTGRQSAGGAGTQQAALTFGGYDATFTFISTEEYDGTSWSTGGTLGTGRRLPGGAGTQDAGLAFGGADSTQTALSSTEEYDGTSWSSGGTLNNARKSLAGTGTQSAALAIAGTDGSTNFDTTEEYDGTSWSSGGTLPNSAANIGVAVGTQDAALLFGGIASGTLQTRTLEYDGTTWSTGGNLNTARSGGAGGGTQDAGLALGGDTLFGGFLTRPNDSTEEYDGTTWSLGGTLLIGRAEHSGAGTQASALVAGGRTFDGSNFGNYVTSSEEYDKPPVYDLTLPPTSGLDGMIRYNNDVSDYEIYRSNAWIGLSSAKVVDSAPTTGNTGEIRFNRDNGTFEGYTGNAWVALS